ncbi:signal peptidase I [Flagellimonas beolgyonensis]|uniref:signal peptidase I n=1 Tax=Flagellimonas beolgyonensis TaxID=864064 RepID=UPI000F8E04AA|nr:signal peptidase I [Allomuricauda beolgyonensis]
MIKEKSYFLSNRFLIYIKNLLLIISLVLLILYYPIWLFIGIVSFFIFLKILVFRLMRAKSYKVGFFLFGFSIYFFILAFCFKLFVADIYYVPTNSMENTIYPGDYVLVNKLAIGPIVPQRLSQFPWLGLIFKNEFSRKINKQLEHYPTRRLKGTDQLERNDVLILEISNKFNIVKRCIAIRGDTLLISMGNVFINGKGILEPPLSKNRHFLEVSDLQKFFSYTDSKGFSRYRFLVLDKSRRIIGLFTNEEIEVLKSSGFIEKSAIVEGYQNPKRNVFAEVDDNSWTSIQMGPFVVPKKSMIITLTPFYYKIYRNTILNYENEIIEEIDGKYYVNGHQIEHYQFKRNYLFVMGDNRTTSIDSRFFGFIPEDIIIGKVRKTVFPLR